MATARHCSGNDKCCTLQQNFSDVKTIFQRESFGISASFVPKMLSCLIPHISFTWFYLSGIWKSIRLPCFPPQLSSPAPPFSSSFSATAPLTRARTKIIFSRLLFLLFVYHFHLLCQSSRNHVGYTFILHLCRLLLVL